MLIGLKSLFKALFGHIAFIFLSSSVTIVTPKAEKS